MVLSDGALLPLGGTINNVGAITLNSTGHETDLQIIGNGVTLQGGGNLILSDSDENVIVGTTAGHTLTNIDNTISGAGQIGVGDNTLTLVNEATIVADRHECADYRHRGERGGQLRNARGDRKRRSDCG